MTPKDCDEPVLLEGCSRMPIRKQKHLIQRAFAVAQTTTVDTVYN